MALARIAASLQEGLTNALKHSGGTRARVVLRYRERELELEISDDGAGAANGHGSRRGLAGIKERVSVFGGHFEAGPQPRGGWTLRASLPLPS
jgi:signal transduction histidine kinase